jgi:hypothetical protein
MKRWIGALVAAISATTALGETVPDEVLPQQGNGSEYAEGQPLEIEPPLLISSRGPDGLPIVPGRDGAPVNVDIAKLEKDIARAIRNASGAERLFKAGIISKVEMEERGLRVVRLQASLENARLQHARRELEEQKTHDSAGELQAGEQSIAQLAEAAARATEERNRAELEAALRNLQRQQKLLVLGSGRKADVSRAQAKLAELQKPKE